MVACGPSRNITGTYATYGFLGTTINLNSDSTFVYLMRGHLSGDSATGIYHIEGRKLMLIYNAEPIDSSMAGRFNRVVKQYRPKEYYIGHNKLFIHYKKEQGYSRHKRYLFWGDYYMTKRRYYLKRISK
jgi:hypothetical protein